MSQIPASQLRLFIGQVVQIVYTLKPETAMPFLIDDCITPPVRLVEYNLTTQVATFERSASLGKLESLTPKEVWSA